MTWNTPKPQEWKSEELSQGRIIDYKAFNFVDGEGVRNSLYVSGCMFHCEGCYNAVILLLQGRDSLYQRTRGTNHTRFSTTLCARSHTTGWRTFSKYWYSTLP